MNDTVEPINNANAGYVEVSDNHNVGYHVLKEVDLLKQMRGANPRIQYWAAYDLSTFVRKQSPYTYLSQDDMTVVIKDLEYWSWVFQDILSQDKITEADTKALSVRQRLDDVIKMWVTRNNLPLEGDKFGRPMKLTVGFKIHRDGDHFRATAYFGYTHDGMFLQDIDNEGTYTNPSFLGQQMHIFC